MTNEATVSVSAIIPVHNRPDAAARAIASALAQVPPVLEVIVVDDASAPPLALPTTIAADPRVRLIRFDANRGASGARQAGIDAARGDHVAFLDSDDLWRPGKLAAQLGLLHQLAGDPLVVIVCGWRWVGEDGVPGRSLIPIAAADPIDFASGCWFCPGSTALIPRAFFASVGGLDPDLRRLEDLDWFLRFALKGGWIAVAPMIGADIQRGRNARRAPVLHAAQRLRARFGPGGAHALPKTEWARLQAYLAIEEAAAARNEGASVAAALALARSFRHAPDARRIPRGAPFHLNDWWRDPP